MFSSILVLAALGIGIGIGAGIWKTESIAATTTVNPEITTTIVTSARLGWKCDLVLLHIFIIKRCA